MGKSKRTIERGKRRRRKSRMKRKKIDEISEKCGNYRKRKKRQ